MCVQLLYYQCYMAMYYRHLKRRINCLEGISPNPLDYSCPACPKVATVTAVLYLLHIYVCIYIAISYATYSS